MMTTERDISLEEAVRKAKPTRFATWIASGNILENSLLANTCVSRISVSWTTRRKNFSVALGTKVMDGEYSHTNLGNFSDLEKVKESFPNLFKVTGTLRIR